MSRYSIFLNFWRTLRESDNITNLSGGLLAAMFLANPIAYSSVLYIEASGDCRDPLIHCVPESYVNRYFFDNSGSFQQKVVKFLTFCGNIATCTNLKL